MSEKEGALQTTDLLLLFPFSPEPDVWVWGRPQPCQRYRECNGRNIDRIHRGRGELVWPPVIQALLHHQV